MASNRSCINCSLSLRPFMRRIVLSEIPDNITNVLRNWTSPTPLTSDSILCHECFMLLQNALLPHGSQTPRVGHQSVCYACGVSILRSKSRRVPLDCFQRNIILQWIAPHQVTRMERVCCACWMAATRTVERQQLHDVQRLEISTTPGPGEINISVPSLPVQNMNSTQTTSALSQDLSEQEINIPIPPPMPVQNSSQPTLRAPNKVYSNSYRRVAATPNHCLFSDCNNTERLLIPSVVKELLLCRYKIYVPLSARICNFHLNSNSWNELLAPYNDFTGHQMDNMLALMQRSAERKIDFTDITNLDAKMCHFWLGFTIEQLQELLLMLPSLSQQVPSACLALSIYLAKIRTGDSNERLSEFFNIPRSTLERYMNKVRNCLSQEFVPLCLGFGCTTVVNVAARNKIIPEGLFGNSELPGDVKPAIVICDGTYVYVQSSSNYKFQKDTYSLHKFTNLIKPFMIVCCDGNILECLGPYKATKNDSTILSEELANEESRINMFFRTGDIFILDRGFRDVVPNLQALGYKAYIPESLMEGEHQLTTMQSNKSRCITMCRWVVEIVNGRIKRDFKLLRQEFFNRAMSHVMDDFRIACALTNKFHPLIEDRPEDVEYLAIARQRLHIENHLAEFVITENINRRRAPFTAIDGNIPQLADFPKLELVDLKRFALGSYQLKQVRSYYGEHIRQNGNYLIEVSEEFEEDLPLVLSVNNNYLVRGRIKSRHVSSKIYYTYILVNKNENVRNTLGAIVGYYCSCLVGKRTVGCCAHVLCILWFLSWARFNNISAPALFLNNIFLEE
ncbi:uncharacterized protein LOC123878594 [Maniola jurtina]|uniref:uncharacterized protein LOC123878594 n=1 Tax=Maniola jurtina TaxID=191418 RepID=UPI001E68EE28|nr:uncharacterized protein LOC123878594 [Maniola jurtina]